jgi:hypothetical protein
MNRALEDGYRWHQRVRSMLQVQVRRLDYMLKRFWADATL